MTEVTETGYRMWHRGSIRPITVPLVAAGGSKVITSQSCRLCGWSLTAAAGLDVGIEASIAVAAAAAGTLTLTGFAGVSVVTVTPAAAWPAGVNQVTITNVTGGTQTVDIEGGTANPAIFQFVPPVGVTGTPVVSVPAIVGGPAYTIEASGISALTGANGPFAAGQWLDSGQPIGQTAALAGLADTQWLSDDGVYVSTNITLSVLSGSMSGVIFIRDAKEDYTWE